MNKYLLATGVSAVALVAASGAMAQKPTLTVGGFVDSKFTVNEQDSAFTAANGKRVNFDQRQDGEIHFNGAVTLDNGIKIRSRVELEAFDTTDGVNDLANFTNGGTHPSDADNIDEAWLDVTGSFGAVRMGSTDMAGKRMTTGHQATFFMNVGENTRFNHAAVIAKPGTVSTSVVSQLDLSSDAESVSYVTPRFAGFQLGGGYASTSFEDSSQLHLKSQATLSDIWDVALNWVGEFGGVGISVATGYTTANTTNGLANNPEQWSLGGRVTFGGFAIGLSTQQNESASASGTSTEEEIYEFGARYVMGPNAFSIVGAWSEMDSTTATINGDESQVYSIAYRRTLGPGVNWHTTLHIADHDDGAAGAAAGNSNDGYGVTTGILLNF